MSNFESLKDFMESEGYEYYVAGGEETVDEVKETGDEVKENWDSLFESEDGINALVGHWDVDVGHIDPPPPQMINRMSVIVANPSHRSYLPLPQAFTITPIPVNPIPVDSIPVDPIPVDPIPINPIPMGMRDLGSGRKGEKMGKEKAAKPIKKKRVKKVVVVDKARALDENRNLPSTPPTYGRPTNLKRATDQFLAEVSAAKDNFANIGVMLVKDLEKREASTGITMEDKAELGDSIILLAKQMPNYNI